MNRSKTNNVIRIILECIFLGMAIVFLFISIFGNNLNNICLCVAFTCIIIANVINLIYLRRKSK